MALRLHNATPCRLCRVRWWFRNVEQAANFTVAFVGPVVPDEPEFHQGAFSPAGTLAVRSVINGLVNAGVDIDEIVSFLPIPKWPRSKRFWVARQTVIIDGPRQARLVSFLNLAFVKEVSIGIAVLYRLVRWGWSRRAKRTRIIYLYNLTVPPGIFVWIAAKIARAKLVAMVFDINKPGETVPRSLSAHVDWWCHRFVIPRLDGLVAITDAIASDFRNGRSYLRVEGGVSSTALVDPPSFDSTQLRNAPFTIVAAGQLNQVNGIDLLLNAFGHLSGRSYRLRIAGSGPLAETVQIAAARDGRIEYCGFLPRADVQRLYATANALVSARVRQATNTTYLFPSKLMEYFVSGVPVITTDVGNIGTEYASFCVTVKDDPIALAEGIEGLASLPQTARATLGDRARQFMLAHKTWDAQARRIRRYILDEVIGKPS
jgi:glycosyltransferase involved in cell wall biosynthesis